MAKDKVEEMELEDATGLVTLFFYANSRRISSHINNLMGKITPKPETLQLPKSVT